MASVSGESGPGKSLRKGLKFLGAVALFPDEAAATKSFGAFIHRLIASSHPGLGRALARFLSPRTLRPRKWMCICQLIVAALLLVTNTEAAGRNGTFVQQVRHPTEENIPSRNELVSYVGLESVSTEDRSLRAAAEWLSGANEVLRIGVSDGELYEMFGDIEDVAVNGDGDIFVLDFQHKKVFVYQSDGSFKHSIGGPGAGPGEFEFPKAIGIDDQDRVIVADSKLRISIFDPHDGAFALNSTLTLAYSPKDMCIGDGMFYLSGAWHEQEGRYVHSYTIDGEHIRSFGELYESSVPLFRQGLSYGPLSCGKEAESVQYAFGWLPVIHNYSKAGERRWTSMLADFNPSSVVSYGNSEVRYENQDKAFDTVSNIVAASANHVLVQIKHITPESREGRLPHGIYTYVFALRSGDGVYVGDRFPQIHAVQRNRIYAISAAPFPQVLVYETDSALAPE
ncbi:MAG: 6-bladed beta-propeller [Rhodothermaceae bacterium]|nr:6-bladed beta-propeller [Rhodothermaceae bacterium]MYD55979.1 6-bladed beta-propeller [Rhodothermaceae bacterium]MYJ55018.1 6-bladed beta-propeller [Rhodothermaceae bacterium]